MRYRLLVLGLLQAGLLACDRTTTSREESQARDEASAIGKLAEPTGSRSAAAGDAAKVANAEGRVGSPGQLPDAGKSSNPSAVLDMIIRTGNASIEVDSLEPAMVGLRRLAERVGGFVANTSVQSGRDQLRQATLEIKVPAARFGELTDGLQPLGRVEYVNVAAEDVGEEFIDLTARASNSRKLETRLIELLATRTGRLQDVLSVERELARVREEIERLDGRLRYLRNRTALSTLTVNLHEPPPIVGDHPGSNVIAEAFRQAWRNFVGLLAGVIASLGILVPVAGVVGAGVLLVKRIRK